MSRAIIIPTDAEPYEADIDLKGNDAIMAVLDGGWLENVTVNPDVAAYLEVGQRDIALVVDEDGLMKRLALNKIATPFYCADPHDGVICGTAVLVGQRRDQEGWEWSDLPAAITVAEVKAAGDYAMSQAGVKWV